MVTFNIKTGGSEGVESREQGFNPKKYTDKPGFLEFLANHPEGANIEVREEDQEELDKLFGAFENVEGAKKKAIEFYEKQFAKVTGEKADKAELKAELEAAFDAMIQDDPEQIEQVLIAFEKFDKMPGEIKEAEARLGRLMGGKSESDFAIALQQAEDAFSTPGKVWGYKRTEEQREALDWLKKIGYSNIRNPEDIQRAADSVMAAAESKEELEEAMRNAKELIFGQSEIASAYRAATEKKIKDSTQKLIDANSIEGYAKAAALLDKIEAGEAEAEAAEKVTVSFGGVDMDLERLKRNLEADSERMALQDISAASAFAAGKNAYKDFEKQMQKLAKISALPGKSAEETREFIIEKVEQVATTYQCTPIQRKTLIAWVSTQKKTAGRA